MAVYSPLKSSVVLRLNAGEGDNGKMIIRSVSMSRIRPTVDATSLKSVTDILEDFFDLPVLAVEKVATDLVDD